MIIVAATQLLLLEPLLNAVGGVSRFARGQSTLVQIQEARERNLLVWIGRLVARRPSRN